ITDFSGPDHPERLLERNMHDFNVLTFVFHTTAVAHLVVQMVLPMSEGKTFVMNFYHPGSPTHPAFYNLKVEGSDKLTLPNGEKLDCWVIFTDYGGTQPTRFWYTKKGQNFVKMEGQYNQVKIYKTRLY
ncbi:MAG: hypothetical protein JJ978_19385, partial [Roseivirga sp.]|uniref:DUF3108 domain-containing protein n=1 Tax=Roseivirga sp. TaxID=1964215 RepID=UPI001B285C61